VIRVLVCDDQWIVCEGLEAILSADADIEVVGLAQDGAEALEKISETQPDLVLMDLKMPVMNGVQATRKIKTLYPEVKVLVLTTYGEDEWVFDAIRNGAAGYLLKGTPRAQLVAAVKGTVAGESYVDPKVAGKLLDHIALRGAPAADSTLVETLTEREREVLALLAQGKSNAEIANELYLSHGTVRNYISAILTKLDVTDRTQAALLALRHGLM
jgi:NarL family two-component system response regulator LiaR